MLKQGVTLFISPVECQDIYLRYGRVLNQGNPSIITNKKIGRFNNQK